MDYWFEVVLNPSPDQADRLLQLRLKFTAACNFLAPIVQQTRCWNRVALHHLTYRQLRHHFPELGSQMVCNAIYSVCRAARHVYQHPSSPFAQHKSQGAAQGAGRPVLPLLSFAPNAPVFFDRHTLSLREGRLSMFTLDGRIRFDLRLSPEHESQFESRKLKEVLLSVRPSIEGQMEKIAAVHMLKFVFGPVEVVSNEKNPETVTATGSMWPDYLQVKETV